VLQKREKGWKLACRSSAETRDRVRRRRRAGLEKRGWYTRVNQSISKEFTALLFHKNDVRCPSAVAPFPLPPSPAAHHIARSLPFHLSALIGDVSRRAASSPFAPPISRSLPVSDRVPLFRVLYYFFYQSARFQDALRPAESCAINHEM